MILTEIFSAERCIEICIKLAIIWISFNFRIFTVRDSVHLCVLLALCCHIVLSCVCRRYSKRTYALTLQQCSFWSPNCHRIESTKFLQELNSLTWLIHISLASDFTHNNNVNGDWFRSRQPVDITSGLAHPGIARSRRKLRPHTLGVGNWLPLWNTATTAYRCMRTTWQPWLLFVSARRTEGHGWQNKLGVCLSGWVSQWVGR